MDCNVNIYTDGACKGNPGPGGYGVIMEWVQKKYRKEFSEGFKITTNNRMELLSVIIAIEKIKREDVIITVYSDSKYVVDSIEKKWYVKWQRKGYKDVKNSDLWKRLFKCYNPKNTSFQWIKGHNNHPENERCDRLAVAASNQKILEEDRGYVLKTTGTFL